MLMWYRFVFPAGLLLLAHSVYLALRIREQLQDNHHGGGDSPAAAYFPMAANGGVAASMNASTLVIFVELLAGTVVAIVGFVKQSTFKRARLVDKNCHQRYDDIMYTGVGFMHFNHRGAVSSNHSGNGTNGENSTLASKKKA